MKPVAIAAALCLMASQTAAEPTLSLPASATRTAEDVRPADSYALPVGPWKNGSVETVATEGQVSQTVWRIKGGEMSTLTLIAPLREQLESDGFDIIFECETDSCGGFDFRFSIPVLPEPEMHVDLGDFRFLAAEGPADAPINYLSLLVSRSSDSGYIQIIRVGPADSEAIIDTASASVAEATAPRAVTDLSRTLLDTGKVVLDDLSFESGTAALSDNPYASLAALAEFLKANPAIRIALVGHTDAEGSLAANVALSRQRADAVRQRLVGRYDVDPIQLAADGVGYLSPIASNLTLEGRTKNRRVEAIVTSTR
ncbi:MAG: OmpA family protein [Paracoccaceae bacterium]